ncbi:uncharacterized protein BP5553_07987 [Venustampulla echinocandica]|uniref:PAS domain-containing protein n=1 Tax=Venustampulla echinocandica TaxID=2656787 RepID=A0A370TFE1_9HELO|nr:uncharacterized protein BP5553_07987 [Venustampulla echinocandica]RDL33619.1 hypothetical protein BP5553_07987 [Venustampulla echinocandica]
MEMTFITIHSAHQTLIRSTRMTIQIDLGRDANILFASESIVDILGYHPDQVIGKSCFDYFHPDEVPFARNVHSRSIMMDKAAMLHYARIQGRDGQWIGCECVFTIVYEVLIACTSIYRGDAKNERRAAEAPAVRHLFTSSPRDPRYHMLEHLASKFRAPPQPSLLEPRAALILNRFTRTLTIMYATDAISTIVGLTPDQFKNKSFYECIQEKCLSEAIRCLSDAKSNDSIAYLRFWYRDPRGEEDFEEEADEASQSSDSEDEGAEPHVSMDVDTAAAAETNRPLQGAPLMSSSRSSAGHEVNRQAPPHIPTTFSEANTGIGHDSSDAFPGQCQPQSSFLVGSGAKSRGLGGLTRKEFMSAIQEVAVFAWGLTGINGNIASYGQGVPRGEAVAPWGLPIWDPYADPPAGFLPPENQAAQRWAHEEVVVNDPYQHPQRKQNPRC